MLVDGHHQSLLRTLGRDPAQDEVEPMTADYYRLDAAPGLDTEAVRRLPRQVRVERLRA